MRRQQETERPVMTRLQRSRRAFVLISLAVFLPLLIMVGLQYFWLVNLKKASTVAHEAKLTNYLRNIEKNISYAIWYPAESLLMQLTEGIFEKPPEKLELFYRKRTYAYTAKNVEKEKYLPVKGVRYMFHNAYRTEDKELYIFDVELQRMVSRTEVAPELRDMLEGTALVNQFRADKMTQISEIMPRQDLTTEGYPMIYVVVPDEKGSMAGIMGVVLNLDYLREQALPEAVKTILPENEEVVLRIMDEQGEVRFGYGCDDAVVGGPEVKQGFRKLLGGGVISVRSNSAYTEWAGNNFSFNVFLSLFLALALALGLIFALRTASREIQLSEMKNDFVSNVSHELRTPLASIRVFGELLHLGRVTAPEKVRDYGELIDTESRRLTQLINNILDFSKIERGCKRYNFESTDLRDVVGRVLKVFEVRLHESDLEIRYREPEASLPMISVDPDAIGQAIFNLVDNGVKYGREGRFIDVRLFEDNETLAISVRDYGIGIPRDECEKIFGRFHRVSTGAVHDVKGSGLGLSIVAHVARAHGGEVTVDSEVGNGSTFTLCLPISRAAVAAGMSPV